VKRLLDILVSLFGLILLSPLLIPVIVLVWLHDYYFPFYIAPRVSINGNTFKMVKLRSMRVNADKAGVDSTSGDDPRITSVGKFIRRYKLDEITQLWNVLIGDMSLVGPRPNVKRETDLYTEEEKKLLTVKPGITDIASIVFSDEGDILEGKADPDLAYNQLIRPWKSRFGLVYIENQNFILDIKLILLTVVAMLFRKFALLKIRRLLIGLNVSAELSNIALREEPLVPIPPPGTTEIVTSRLSPVSG